MYRWLVFLLCLPPACVDDRGGPSDPPGEVTDGETCEENPTRCDVASCDPLFQDCPNGQGCYPTGSGFDCTAPTGDQRTGDPCAFFTECTPGLVCAAGPTVPNCYAQGCCTEFCDRSNGTGGCLQASAGSQCVMLYAEGNAPPGLETLGVCGLGT